MTPIQVYNVLVIFSFAACGVTTFLLAHYFTRSYWSSIFAGYVFTFSSYHFAHMEGHLNLLSLEWVPLFVLCWYILVVRPGVTIAIAAGIVLFAVLLCDYYYFFYCTLIGLIIFAWHGLRTKNAGFFLERKYLVSLTVFLSVVLLTSGPLVISLLLLNSTDPITGHNPLINSMDVLAPFIPGSHWRFANLTRSYWSRLPGDANENSVYLGWAVVFLILYVWRRCPAVPSLRLWFFIVFCFGVLALGPVLHVWGAEYSRYQAPVCPVRKIIPAHTGIRGSCEDDDYCHAGGLGAVRSGFGPGIQGLVAGTEYSRPSWSLHSSSNTSPKPRVTSVLTGSRVREHLKSSAPQRRRSGHSERAISDDVPSDRP